MQTPLHILAIFGVLALTWLTACNAQIGAGSASSNPLLVAAAASVEPAFTELGAAYTAQTGNAVDFVFGSSGNLATQIENGAPFDVFASADEGFVDRLADNDLVLHDTVAVYANGRLVLAVNRESGITLDSIADLADVSVQRVAIANPELAPYGAAAREALQQAGIWQEVESKIVQGANVRQALQYVQTGDAAAGLVALSIVDVPEVRYTLVNEDLYTPLQQAMAIVAATDQERDAREFTDFVLGPVGQSILAKHGFAAPGAL